MYQCDACSFKANRQFMQCPECGSTDISTAMPSIDRPSDAFTYFRPLNAMRHAIDKIMTDTVFDHIVNGRGLGFPLNRTILFYGGPGIGKSWLARKLMLAFKAGVYFHYEEHADIVLGKFSEMVDDVNAYPRIMLSDIPFSRTVMMNTIRSKPSLIVVDSIQMAEVGDALANPREDVGTPGSAKHLVALTREAIKAVQAIPGLSVLLVAHENKDEQVAGPRTVEHMVDVVIQLNELRSDTNVEDVPPQRFISIEKNRCGQKGTWDVSSS